MNLLRIEISKGILGNGAVITWSSCNSWSSIHWTSRWFVPAAIVVLNGKLPFDRRKPTIGYREKEDNWGFILGIFYF